MSITSSSFITNIMVAENNTVIITMKSGTYKYTDTIYSNLDEIMDDVDAWNDSWGAWYNKCIRGKYNAEKVVA